MQVEFCLSGFIGNFRSSEARDGLYTVTARFALRHETCACDVRQVEFAVPWPIFEAAL